MRAPRGARPAPEPVDASGWQRQASVLPRRMMRRHRSHRGSARAPDRGVRRWAWVLLVGASVLSVPTYALTAASLNSTPVPREFNGWAAAFARDVSVSSQVFLTMAASNPGGYGSHPIVEYGITVCGKKTFDGLLVLAGDARLHGAGPESQPSALTSAPGSLSHLPEVLRLTIEDLSDGGKAEVTAVQAFRVKIPAVRCRSAYDPTSKAPTHDGHTVVLRGPLEGAAVRHGFAPLGLRPVRQAQSWPLLGQVPVFNPADHGAFRFGPQIPGLWVRPFASYFGVHVGLLDGKASVDFARPETAGSEALSWTSTKPIAAKARVTDVDSFNKWQTASIAAAILLGIGGSILATVVLKAVRPARPTPGPAYRDVAIRRDTPGTQANGRSSPPFLTGLTIAAIAFLLHCRRRPRKRS